MQKKYQYLSAFFLLLIGVSFFISCQKKPEIEEPAVKPAGGGVETTQSGVASVDQNQLWNWVMALEDDYGLDDVQIKQAENFLIVKFKAPTISSEEIDEGLAQILGYLDLQLPDSIDKIRLVFVVNYVDSAVIEVDRAMIAKWREGIIDNIEFIDSFKKISLLSLLKIGVAHAQKAVQQLPLLSGFTQGAEAPKLANDPLQVMIDLKNDDQVKFTVVPLIDISLQGVEKTQAEEVRKQKDSISNYVGDSNGGRKLSKAALKKIDLVRELVAGKLGRDQKKWDDLVTEAETARKFRRENDGKIFDQLEMRRRSLIEQISRYEAALEVSRKQSLQYMNNGRPFAATMWEGDSQYSSMPKRDFMKETKGNSDEALVLCSKAIGTQYSLIGEMKDQLRKIRNEQWKLLDVPPKPDPVEALESVKMDWYV